MRLCLFAIVAALAAAAPVMAHERTMGEAELRELLAAGPAGAAVRCLTLRRIQSSYVINGTAIVYEEAGSRIWVNRPDSGSKMLSGRDTLVITSRNGLVCDGDPVDLIDRSSRQTNGFVLLGEFLPYAKAAEPMRN